MTTMQNMTTEGLSVLGESPNCSLNSSCGTSTSDSDGVNLNADVYMNIIYTVIGIVGMAGNALVGGVLLHFKSMRRSLTNTFIINQSCLDGTVSLCIILSAYARDANMIESAVGQELFCRLWLTNLPIWGIFVSSTYNMVAVTFERYSALVYPLSHHKYFTRKKALMIISAVWFVGPAYNAAYMIPTAGMVDGQCVVYSIWPNHVTQKAAGILTVFLQYFIPLSLIIFAYSKITLVLTKAGNASGQQTTSGNRDNIISKARRNVIKTLALVSACFVFCWSWNQIYYTMYNCGFDADFNSTFYHFTVIMVFCNCCINPFVYAAKYEQFQKGLRKILCGGKYDSSSDNSTHTTRVSVSIDVDEKAKRIEKMKHNNRLLQRMTSDPTIVASSKDGSDIIPAIPDKSENGIYTISQESVITRL